MSRRRYLSTDISVDPKVTELARQHGDFAALLYTWMIPHAADDCSITADADQIALMVVPGWRHRTADDIRAAVGGMVELGLLALDDGARKLCFPPASFYRYQTYIKPANRRATAPASQPRPSGQGQAQNAEQQRETPQITASVKPSPPPSHSPSLSPPELRGAGAAAPAADAATPIQPAIPKTRAPGASFAPVIDAMRALGLRAPPIEGREIVALQSLLKLGDPLRIAQCWQEVAAGEVEGLGPLDRANVSFWWLSQNNRFFNWLSSKEGGNGKHGAPSRNGAFNPRSGAKPGVRHG